jgi:hypothetical protein
MDQRDDITAAVLCVHGDNLVVHLLTHRIRHLRTLELAVWCANHRSWQDRFVLPCVWEVRAIEFHPMLQPVGLCSSRPRLLSFAGWLWAGQADWPLALGLGIVLLRAWAITHW